MKQIEVPDTPLMQQYQALKNSYPHAVLFFRLGDFYEMFYEDARTASSVLGIALTSRQGAPMCGIPYHSHTSYVSRLLDAGYKVAICEQISQGEDEKTKLKKREVVRLLTPGTLIEEDFLETKRSNHLLAVHIDIVGWAAACIEVSTGEFFATQNLNDPHYYHLRSFVSKTSPSEIIIDSKDLDELKKRGILFPKTAITAYSPDAPERSEQGGIVRNRRRELCERPEQEPDWVQQSIWQNHKPAMKACLHIISYVRETQPGIKQIFSPVYFEPSNKLQMDESAVKTLELTDSEDNTGKASLWEILDNARTPMGSRLLKKWILEPLTDIYEITRRQDFVSFLAENPGPRETLGDLLCQIPDIERILGRIANSSAAPRDASSIRRAIYQIPRLKSVLGQGSFFEFSPEIAGKLDSVSGTLGGLRAVLEKALVENPPARISDGGVIKEGYNAELDELRNTRKNSRKTLIDLEAAEKQKTGIPSLKVGFNNNFGYYIEITKAHLHKVPHYYTRKQTLVNAERFITQELKEIESKVLGAEERIIKLETSIFQEIRDLLLQNLKELKIFAMCVSELDAFYSLAVSAVKYEYSRPEITTGNELYIEEGRHPIVEKNLPGGAFVPNNLSLGAENSTIILTGPNMSGKSVYLRQNALLVIMAQMGSFVPAKSARIGITDRIMTRIGAHDRLALGESLSLPSLPRNSLK
ncbi:MAG: DNA mismatch repair protein MutS [Elusimicrobia bacterium]|nr:DNA mismatch repair protein MutS [Elusimicrobiota bacterium]